MTMLSLLLLSLPLASCAALLPVESVEELLSVNDRAVADHFTLYGYGQGSDGLELFLSNGYAFLGNVTNTTTIEAQQIFFSEDSSDSSIWTVTPAAANSANWTEKVYFIPSADATDRRTGFIDSDATASDDEVTDGFGFYGKTAFHSTDAGAMETHWYATLAYPDDGVFSLRWRADTDYPESAIPITLRAWAPPPPLALA